MADCIGLLHSGMHEKLSRMDIYMHLYNYGPKIFAIMLIFLGAPQYWKSAYLI